MVATTLSQQQISDFWDQLQTDPTYHTMLLQLRELEPKYDAVIASLSVHDQDIICDYVSLCEGMNERALELAVVPMQSKKVAL